MNEDSEPITEKWIREPSAYTALLVVVIPLVVLLFGEGLADVFEAFVNWFKGSFDCGL